MGNRAVIIPESAVMNEETTVGIYVHWYDESDLMTALAEMQARGYRSIEDDDMYGMARLCQVLCEQNQDGLNIGLTVVDPREPDEWLDEGYIAIGGWTSIHRVAMCGGHPRLVEEEEEDEE